MATPFLEAKAIARERGPLTLEAAGRAEGLAPLPALSVRVGRDALNLARAVRFFVATAGGARASVQPLSDGAASVEAPQGAFTWWAELLGERRAVLLALKSEAEPFRVTLEPEPKALAPAQATAAAQPAVTLQVEPAPPRLRPLAWTLLGLGAASAVVGGVFGLEANLAWSRLNGATRDGAGAITGLTRTDALELDRGLRRDALIANVTLISAAALLALGLLVFWLGGS